MTLMSKANLIYIYLLHIADCHRLAPLSVSFYSQSFQLLHELPQFSYNIVSPLCKDMALQLLSGRPELLNLVIPPGSAKRTEAFTDIWIPSGHNITQILHKAAFIAHLDREATALSENAILSESWQSHSTITTVLL